MRVTLEQVEQTMAQVGSALTYLREARHEAKKIRGDDVATGQYAKYAVADLRKALETLTDMEVNVA